jgi:hypothetical protein
MGDSFSFYLHRLELIAFFSGYPLIYTTVLLIGGKRGSRTELQKKLVALLPFSYALVGTLYFGFELMDLQPNSTNNFREFAQHPFLTVWGKLAMLFWIPAIAKRPILSLLHSLVFFFFLVNDIFLQISASSVDKNIVRNDMKIYSVSILLNLTALILVILISLLITRIKKQKRSTHI